QVQLLKTGKEIDKVAVQLPPEGGSRDVQFKLSHPEVGTETYTVRIPVLPGEVQTNDNEMVVAVDVLDAKNRVLFLEDVPRFESKHFARSLFANKDITPLAFFQMPSRTAPGTKEWIAYGDRQGLVFDLTSEQISLNKIIVLGDFDAEALSAEHCRTILGFVEKGGSLILLGGQKLWGASGIAQTELAKLLPFTRAGSPALEGKFNVAWTAEGRAHPALANNPDMPSALPPVLSVFTGVTLSGGAFALAEAQTDSGTHPLLVSRIYGQGKVLAVLTDSLWRWVMQPGEDKPYPKFWRQIVQWMSPSESDLDNYHLELFTDAGTIAVGDPAILQSRLVIPPNETRKNWKVSCEITTPSDRVIPLAMAGRSIQASGGAELPGYVAEFVPNEPGNYRAMATVEIDGKKIVSTPCLFTVRATSQEMVLKPINDNVLKALARSSGGRYGTPEEIDATLQDLRVNERRERKLEYRSLWQTPFVLACLIALLAIEWVTRKLKNMS
ncbi:MAG: glutamine amidotransferase, partial [Kiritimatiellia bacterium]